MPSWSPKPEWKGQTAFIIGGGSSLRGFDFSVLRGRNTIGCNHAYQLGPEIIQFCLFADPSFWEQNKEQLAAFRGRVVTCAAVLLNKPIPWLLQMRRIRDGLHEGNILGWNYSTGASAVNLAFSLGAVRIFLLGFDMGSLPNGTNGKPATHWHNAHPTPVREEAYRRFLRGFHTLAASLKRHPHVSVVNVTNGSSRLDVFPLMGLPTFLSILKEEK